LKSHLAKTIDAGLFDAALASLVAEGSAEARADQVRAAGAGAWTPALQAAQDRVIETLTKSGHSVPELSSLPADAGEHVQRLVCEGRGARVGEDFVYTKEQWQAVEDALRRNFETKPALRVADLKDLL